MPSHGRCNPHGWPTLRDGLSQRGAPLRHLLNRLAHATGNHINYAISKRLGLQPPPTRP